MALANARCASLSTPNVHDMHASPEKEKREWQVGADNYTVQYFSTCACTAAAPCPPRYTTQSLIIVSRRLSPLVGYGKDILTRGRSMHWPKIRSLIDCDGIASGCSSNEYWLQGHHIR
ncbi:unnamed protein product [Periconia digitata]|uniref:Uncharacterized protein n=1 Tax=Periconia digitata TaxID=1303443 RepID=A0A9W4UG57_9PLEO|nr:unnamed protein product [Periconia digitata]